METQAHEQDETVEPGVGRGKAGSTTPEQAGERILDGTATVADVETWLNWTYRGHAAEAMEKAARILLAAAKAA